MKHVKCVMEYVVLDKNKNHTGNGGHWQCGRCGRKGTQHGDGQPCRAAVVRGGKRR